MKTIVSALAVFFGVNVFATTVQITPNLFNCTGENDTQLNFSTTSLIGKPQLNVKFRGADIVSNTEVSLMSSPLGTLATIQDYHMALVDGPMIRYTLVVPHVILSASETSEKFSTIAIRTSVGNPLFGPASNARVIEYNDVVSLECTAQQVVF